MTRQCRRITVRNVTNDIPLDAAENARITSALHATKQHTSLGHVRTIRTRPSARLTALNVRKNSQRDGASHVMSHTAIPAGENYIPRARGGSIPSVRCTGGGGSEPP